MTGQPPWAWRIVDTHTDTIIAHGVQWTRPLASPAEVAAERMACHAWRAHLAGEGVGLAPLVCIVWSPADPGRAGRSAGRVWMLPEQRIVLANAVRAA